MLVVASVVRIIVRSIKTNIVTRLVYWCAFFLILWEHIFKKHIVWDRWFFFRYVVQSYSISMFDLSVSVASPVVVKM